MRLWIRSTLRNATTSEVHAKQGSDHWSTRTVAFICLILLVQIYYNRSQERTEAMVTSYIVKVLLETWNAADTVHAIPNIWRAMFHFLWYLFENDNREFILKIC